MLKKLKCKKTNSNNLVVCRLNPYVVKERIHCFLVPRSVVTLLYAVAMVFKGNVAQNQQFCPHRQLHRTSC